MVRHLAVVHHIIPRKNLALPFSVQLITTREQQALRTRSKYFRGGPIVFRNIWTGGSVLSGDQLSRDKPL